jgi:hypothetical protein
VSAKSGPLLDFWWRPTLFLLGFPFVTFKLFIDVCKHAESVTVASTSSSSSFFLSNHQKSNITHQRSKTGCVKTRLKEIFGHFDLYTWMNRVLPLLSNAISTIKCLQ